MDDQDCEEIGNILHSLEIDALVFVGGPEEISHVAQLVEYFIINKFPISVISVFQSPNDSVHYPPFIERTLGFDTAVVTLCELIGNLKKFPDFFLVPCGSSIRTAEIARRLNIRNVVSPSETYIPEESAKEISDSISATVLGLTLLVVDGVDIDILRLALERHGRNFRVINLKMLSRMAFPSISDCNRGVSLGLTAAYLAASGKHGTVAFAEPSSAFFGGFPLGAILRDRQSDAFLALDQSSEPSSPELGRIARLKSFRESSVPEITIRRHIHDSRLLAFDHNTSGGPCDFDIFPRIPRESIPSIGWTLSPATGVDFEGIFRSEKAPSAPRLFHIIVGGYCGASTNYAVAEFIEHTRNSSSSQVLLWKGSWQDPPAGEELIAETQLRPLRAPLPAAPVVSDGIVIFGDFETLKQARDQYSSKRTLLVPCDSRNAIPGVPCCLGFPTTVRVLCSVLGSLSTLAASTRSDWVFALVEGKSIERLAVQCSRETNVQAVLVPELFVNTSETKIVKYLADLIAERSAIGSDFGVVVISESMTNLMKEKKSFRVHEYLKEKVSKELSRRAFLGNTNALFSCVLYELNLALALFSPPHQSDVSLGRLYGAAAADFLCHQESGYSSHLILGETLTDNDWKLFAVAIQPDFPSQLPFDMLTDLSPSSQRRFVNMGPMQTNSTDELSGPVVHSKVFNLSKLHLLLHKLRVAAKASNEPVVRALLDLARNLITRDPAAYR